jgi:hypothetical protein
LQEFVPPGHVPVRLQVLKLLQPLHVFECFASLQL